MTIFNLGFCLNSIFFNYQCIYTINEFVDTVGWDGTGGGGAEGGLRELFSSQVSKSKAKLAECKSKDDFSPMHSNETICQDREGASGWGHVCSSIRK